MKKVLKTSGNLNVYQELKNQQVFFKFYLPVKTKYFNNKYIFLLTSFTYQF